MTHKPSFNYKNPNDAASMTQWAREFVNQNPFATLLDYEKIMSDHGLYRRSGRSQYYQACREYRDRHGLGKLPRGGDGKPKPANHGQRLPTRKKVAAVGVKNKAMPAKEDNGFPPTLDALRRSGPEDEIREVTMKLLLWMQKYSVRVISVECDSQEVTMSNAPAVARQRVPSPHFTVQDE